MLLFIVLILIFSIPWVQTSVADKLTESLNQQYGVNIQVGGVQLAYNGNVVLDDVFIADHHQDTLISAQEVESSLTNIPGLLSGKELNFSNSVANNLKFHIRRYKGEEKDNLAIFSEKFESDGPRSKNPFALSIGHVSVTNSEFTYVDENNTYPHIITLNDLNIDASDLSTHGPKLSVAVNTLRAKEARGLQINNLSVDVNYDLTGMHFEHMHLQTPNSDMQSDIEFSYDGPEALSDFENKVNITAHFKDSKISTTDLRYYYDEFGRRETLNLNGDLTGTLNNFNLTHLRLKGMDRSVIAGTMNLKGIFESNHRNFRISGNFNQLSTNYYDLVNLLPRILGRSLPKKLRDIGSVTLRGKLSTTGKKVTTKADLSSQLGNAKLDLVLTDLNDPDFASYKGNLVFEKFNLGRLLGNSDLGTTTLNVDVDGVGFSQKTLNTAIKGTISELNFKGYAYHDITVIGVLDNPVFNGKLVSNDPNFKFEFNGLADVSNATNEYNFTANVSYANLNALHFVQRDSVSVFKGQVRMNMRATSFDDATGTIFLSNASYKNQKQTYAFEQLQISSSFKNQVRTIIVNSPDIINGKVSGKFNVKEIPALFENALGSLYTNYKPIKIAQNQYVDFNFNIYNKIVEVLFPKITLAPKTYIRGSVESDDSEFKLTFKSPKIKAFDNMFQKVNLKVDNSNPLFNTYLEIDSISTGLYNFSKLNLINVTLNDTLFIRTKFKGGKKNDDEFNLSLYHTINEQNKSVVGIRKSSIKFKKSTWFLNEQNKKDNVVVFDNKLNNISLDTLVLSHKKEAIRLSGRKKDSTYKNFKLDFHDVDLGKITPDIDSLKLDGIVNGKLNFLQEKGVYYPSSSLKIKDVAVNGAKYGNMALNIKGNEDLSKYQIKALLGNDTYDFLTANGSINVSEETPNIDVDLALKNFKMKAFSPIGGDVISNIRGIASGRAKVSGSYKNPKIKGQLRLQNAGLTIPYLNVDLDFKQDAVVNLSKQQFNFDHVGIEDTKYHTKGTLNGTISHHDFRDWNLDLTIDAPEKLLVLDTKETEDALYYGTAFISGNATLRGPTDELAIRVNAKTEKGTVFKIPLSDTESIGDNSFIYFLSEEQKKARQAGKEIHVKEVKGLELFFDLDITSDAEVEVVVDKKSGSTLRGSGAGTLLIEINTNGKFNMWGDFVVYKGVYNFKYAGLVQKEFEVVSGGSITWDGSPTRADLNVRALYKANANPAILLENPSINRNIPVNVFINLNGELTNTNISFDLEYPNLSSVVKSELEYRINDRENTELQALSLITQNSFYSQYAPAGQNAPGNLLFERASGLFDDIFGDDDGKFKVGINYTQGDRTPDQDTADRFGVTLSTQISDRILINGQVGVPIGGVNESVVVGNVEINFLLNKDGNLKANLFNRENNIQYIGEDLGYTQGVGLSYTVDFDTFKELIRKVLNKKLKVQEVPKNIKKTKEESLAPDYIHFPGSE